MSVCLHAIRRKNRMESSQEWSLEQLLELPCFRTAEGIIDMLIKANEDKVLCAELDRLNIKPGWCFNEWKDFLQTSDFSILSDCGQKDVAAYVGEEPSGLLRFCRNMNGHPYFEGRFRKPLRVYLFQNYSDTKANFVKYIMDKFPKLIFVVWALKENDPRMFAWNRCVVSQLIQRLKTALENKKHRDPAAPTQYELTLRDLIYNIDRCKRHLQFK